MMRRYLWILLVLLLPGFIAGAQSKAMKKLNSINCAKVLAERNIVETVYGIKVKFTEEVNNILDGVCQETTETKPGKRAIKGIEFEPPKYDSQKDIAQVTATLKMKRIADIVDRKKFNIDKNPDKVIKRVAFATSTPANASRIAALRAAEIDAYKNMYKKIGGFTLESHSKVENFILKSEHVKASVIGAIMGAEFMGFHWDGEGADAIAVVKLRVNIKELSQMLGQKVIDFDREYLEAMGYGAIKPEAAQTSIKTPNAGGKSLIKTEVLEDDLGDIMP